MRKELIWVSAIIAFSILLVAASTSFKFDSLTIQLHDTYIVSGSVHTIIFLSILFLLGRYACQFILFLIHHAKPFAIAAAMILPLVVYLIGVYMYLMLSVISVIGGGYSEITNQQDTWIVYIPALIFILSFIVIEIIAIRKIASRKL